MMRQSSYRLARGAGAGCAPATVSRAGERREASNRRAVSLDLIRLIKTR